MTDELPERARGQKSRDACRQVASVSADPTALTVVQDAERTVGGSGSGTLELEHLPLASTVSESAFQRGCLTLGDISESPVIEVESGLVFGFHHSGRWVQFKRGEAPPLWTLAEQALLSGLGACYEDPS